MIEASDPFANENDITPIIIIIAQNPCSRGFDPDMSPYPTVVIVDIVQ